jgi:hypothetical protein
MVNIQKSLSSQISYLHPRNNFMKQLLSIFLVFLLASCGGNDHYIQNPVDLMIKSMKDQKTYTIILDDMDVKKDNFYHKYSIVKESTTGEISSSSTELLLVDYAFFKANDANLGMQLASKDSTGKVSKNVIPAGYDNYVGNSKYGQWQGSGHDRSWVFFGQYMFMRSMFGLGYHPAYYHMHHNYYSNYYGTNRPFYGSGSQGGNYYGTSSAQTKKSKPGFFERKARNNNWQSSRKSASSRRSGRGGGFGYGK